MKEFVLSYRLFFIISLLVIINGCEFENQKNTDNNSNEEQAHPYLDSFPQFPYFKKEIREPDLENYHVQEAQKIESIDLGVIQNFDVLDRGNGSENISHHLIKIRDEGDSTAVPVLIEFLKKLESKGNYVYKYVALQVLYCIGTEKAHEYLQIAFSKPNFYIKQSIQYMYGYGMDIDYIENFINDYHLIKLSNDLNAKIDVADKKIEGDWDVVLRVELSNVSERVLSINRVGVYPSRHLVIKNSSGLALESMEIIEYGMPSPRWEKLFPDSNYIFYVPLKLKERNSLNPMFFKHWLKNVDYILDARDIWFKSNEKGKFNIYACYEVLPLPARLKENPPPYLDTIENRWVGRVVSEPIEVYLE